MATRSVGGGWEQLFWEVFRSTANPVGLLDEDRRFVDLNEPTERIFDRSRGELLARPITEIIATEQREIAAHEWETFLRTGVFAGNRTFIRGDGKEVSLELAGRLTTISGTRRAVFVIIAEPWHPVTASASDREKHLTGREREVVALIAMGLDSNEIAKRLYVSPETVRTHVRNAMRRLGAHTRAQLVCVALTSDASLGLLHMEE